MSPAEIRTIYQYVWTPAAPDRVWRALTDSAEFGAWFRAKADRMFEPSSLVRMVSTHPSCAGLEFSIAIEEMLPERRFSWRWHPGAKPDPIETLVEFELQPERGGTMVTVTESGFDRIPTERRDAVFHENEEGWKEQMAALGRYLLQDRIRNR
jgi:uncharacterized protein YndB with AHSA1/START domain